VLSHDLLTHENPLSPVPDIQKTYRFIYLTSDIGFF